MKVDVVFDAEAHYSISHDGATIAPGAGPLPSPPVLFAGSLAACCGVFAVNYLKTRDLPYAGLVVSSESGYAEDPRRLGDILIKVHLPVAVDERHLAPLERAINLCTLKNTIEVPPSVKAELLVPSAVR
jgi:ribosomal protein S12 methylthiotransferase accessory factor